MLSLHFEHLALKFDNFFYVEGEEKSDQKSVDNTTATNTTANATKEENTKPKLVTVKEPIATEESIVSLKPLSLEQLDKSADKLAALNEHDRQRTRRETALNHLETLVIDARSKLETDEYANAATPAEAEKIRAACSEISDWLYEDGADADAETYEKKINEIQDLTNDLYARVWEHHERPEALRALHQMLNGSTVFLNNARNLTKAKNPDKDVFTDVEIDTLNKVIVETTEWRDRMIIEQEKTKKSEPVMLSVKMITEKMAALDREVKYLVNKLKIWRPKAPPVKEVKEDTKNTSDKEETNKTERPETTGEDGKDENEAQIEEENEEKGNADEENHSEL